MDILSEELNVFLTRLGNAPETVSEKTEHYIKHILQLLTVDHETIVKEYYGLFGVAQLSAEKSADTHGLSSDEVRRIVNNSVRKLAVTPEWQMIKQTI